MGGRTGGSILQGGGSGIAKYSLPCWVKWCNAKFLFDIRQKTGVDHPCLLCPYSSRNIIFQAELMQKME